MLAISRPSPTTPDNPCYDPPDSAREFSERGMSMQEPRTLNDIYAVTCAIDRPAIMKLKRGEQWVDVTVPEFRDTVRWLAMALHDMGVKAGDRVAILSENRPEWTMSRLRHPLRLGGDGSGLSDAARLADRVHPQRCGSGAW